MTARSPNGSESKPRIKTFSGSAIAPYIDDLARLRISVFAAFPYLYAGSADYEARYLKTYARSPRSFFALALDGDAVVGAATAMPLEDETDEVKAPFRGTHWPMGEIFYFGESVLMPRYRGQGIGVTFFEEREAQARTLGFDYCAFCAVQRPADHPARPDDHVPLDGFWTRRGYRHHPELATQFSWTDIGDARETAKPMSFWLRKITD